MSLWGCDDALICGDVGAGVSGVRGHPHPAVVADGVGVPKMTLCYKCRRPVKKPQYHHGEPYHANCYQVVATNR